jgi:hypothetical protein
MSGRRRDRYIREDYELNDVTDNLLASDSEPAVKTIAWAILQSHISCKRNPQLAKEVLQGYLIAESRAIVRLG